MEKKASALRGVFWIVWVALVFFLVLVGVGSGWDRYVVTPYCTSACASRGQSFDHFEPGRRSGPPSACLCADQSRVETELADAGMGLGAVLFLVACWVPLFVMARRDDARAPRP